MKTFVISGGTDGIGKAVALARLEQGDQVVVLGRNAEKGAAILAEAERLGAAERGHFIQVDLTGVAATRAAIAEIRSRFGAVDGLVLCAQHFRSERLVTAEGFENTFAVYYLSRFLLSHEMVDLLEAAPSPVVVNVCGPGIPMGEVRWNDLGREREYAGLDALMQGSRLNDLLGVGFTQVNPSSAVRYVLLNPGGVRTSFSGEYDQVMAEQIEAMRKVAKPVEEGILPILAVLDTPPTAPLTASMMGDPLPLDGSAFDAEDARKLHELTIGLLAVRTG
ncbi:NAD(P)-dependent dehydrogenase (short-subunit alcohol dehydrogenase family) [Saccharothrix ecbatanensis]|uniref:NAD(P)-dependent dehydrogenase (Short-subunit alcohol dehydrogenase family) n=1 Tax=Saccharothrix ecbatanensis TaxID=1105145 RepID=A0A7W9M0R5_9PSEU|nr:SDR family NAD(P)-dependent oxidoreductase [Saccharothrix ecbatanensis]MBB5803219.1 NAD(P)-dependent dehydrogenase (short-subunit alcohol dehydrogenase family) [Saccharothrix ecbatanensis]